MIAKRRDLVCESESEGIWNLIWFDSDLGFSKFQTQKNVTILTKRFQRNFIPVFTGFNRHKKLA